MVETDSARRARLLARAKARSVAVIEPDAVVIGADQVCHLEGEVFHKPADPEDHMAQLRRLRGRTHELVTGVALVGPGVERLFDDRTTIRLRDLSDAELGSYLRTGEGQGCAGGYQVEGVGAQLIEHVGGDWFNVVGLPVLRLISELRALGWRPWASPE